MKLLTTFALSLLLLASCTKEMDSDVDVNNPTKEEDCYAALCTEDLRFIVAKAVDKDGNPVSVLDEDLSVYYTESKEAIDMERGRVSDLSNIFVVSDNYDVAFEGTSITVEVKVNKFKTVKKEFIIARDCCHVYNPEGQVLEIEI